MKDEEVKRENAERKNHLIKNKPEGARRFNICLTF
jgi:hypothetical protein